MPHSSTPQLAGVTLRAATVADAEPLRALMAASSRAVIGEDDVTLADVTATLSNPRLDPEKDTLLALSDSTVVGYVEAVVEGDDRASLDVYAHPDLADDEFARVAEHLAAWGLARLGDEAKAGTLTVGTGCYRAEHRLAQALVASGMRHVRVWWRMAVALDAPAAQPRPVPDGVRIRRALVATDTEDSVLAHAVKLESFRDHFGESPETYDQFWQRARRQPGYDPTLWWLAEVDGRPCGLLSADNRKIDEGTGWVRTLGVLPDARGRGAAAALLRTAFDEFRSRGMATVQLAVDSQNTTGATALYESVGMRPEVVIDSYEAVVPT